MCSKAKKKLHPYNRVDQGVTPQRPQKYNNEISEGGGGGSVPLPFRVGILNALHQHVPETSKAADG